MIRFFELFDNNTLYNICICVKYGALVGLNSYILYYLIWSNNQIAKLKNKYELEVIKLKNNYDLVITNTLDNIKSDIIKINEKINNNELMTTNTLNIIKTNIVEINEKINVNSDVNSDANLNTNTNMDDTTVNYNCDYDYEYEYKYESDSKCIKFVKPYFIATNSILQIFLGKNIILNVKTLDNTKNIFTGDMYEYGEYISKHNEKFILVEKIELLFGNNDNDDKFFIGKCALDKNVEYIVETFSYFSNMTELKLSHLIYKSMIFPILFEKCPQLKNITIKGLKKDEMCELLIYEDDYGVKFY
jgi:hypothetical protein